MSNPRFFKIFLVILASLLIVGVAHCAPSATPYAISNTSGKLVIGGSNAAYPALQALTTAFSQRYPRVEIDYESSSQTSTAVKYILERKLDIGATARPLNEQANHSDVKQIHIARDGIVIAVHPKVAVAALTSAQVQGIYQGTVRSWAQVGGPDREIVVLDRLEGAPSKIALRQFVLGANLATTPDAVFLPSERDMYEAVATVPDAIGYFSYTYVAPSSTRVRVVTLDGVAPSLETLGSGAYRVTRPIGVVVRSDQTNVSPLREFLTFLTTPEAHAALLKASVIPEAQP